MTVLTTVTAWTGQWLNDAAERYQQWWHRTAVDRLARHERRQEAGHGR